jgi:hypothetical protein
MLSLVALLALLAPQDPKPGPAVDWAEVMRRFQADAAALQKTGVALDLAALKIQNLPPGDLAREIEKRETSFFGESWYEMLWVLGQALGLQLDATADAFKVTFVRVSSGTLPARYVPALKAVVIDENQYTDDGRLDRSLLHALALASLDQQPGGLAALRSGTTTDELLASRAWIEGRAGLLARRTLGETVHSSLSAFEERTGSFALIDLNGQSEAARQELLPEAERARPTSSSMLLRGRAQAATPIVLDTLAPVGAKLLREDSLGELGLRFVLSMGGAHPVRSLEAGIGLAADRLRLWKYGDREREFVWRLVFDRESDAAELEAMLQKLAKGTRVRRANVLDWSFGTRPEREAELAKLLAALPLPPAPPEADARSTAERQAARLALQPRLEGERWLLPEFDLAWKLPGGWKPSFYQADAIVYIGAPDEGFRDNLTFREYGLPEDATPERVLEGSRKSFAGLASAKLLRSELVDTPAGRGVLVEFVQSSSGRDVHQLELQIVLPGRKQAVTATLLEKHWKAAAAGIEALLRATDRCPRPAQAERAK